MVISGAANIGNSNKQMVLNKPLIITLAAPLRHLVLKKDITFIYVKKIKSFVNKESIN